ncbi:MAG: arginine--tRNA ligase [Candidatus Electryoneaceae bacterium]|nr:arginine--tRNA ligase [Candidatus Electryoneaceae bacterium]
MNIVSARAASVGNTLVNVFKKRGYDTHSEYYVNDGGRQVKLLGASVRVRLDQLDANTVSAPPFLGQLVAGVGGPCHQVIPDGGYHGEYVIDIARAWREDHPDISPPDDMTLGLWAANRIRGHQEKTLKKFRVTFDRWFRESEIYADADNGPETVIEKLNERGLTYTKDGALFFKASEFGDSEDRVVITSDGRFTYIVPDIAYHLRKHQNFGKAVNLLGPDHHGHILQLKAALKALETPDDSFIPMIVQQVNLKRAGQPVKMSKRAGVGITMEELLDEVGVDAARFFFLRRKITSPLDFDIELAKSHSDENPVYYVQYAHARIQSILHQPAASVLADYSSKSDQTVDLTVLTAPEDLDLLRVMARFPWTLSAVVRGVDPHPLVTYLIDLARAFHSFYANQRVISDDTCLTVARLILCRGTAGVIAEGLRLIGVEAPDRM